MSALSDKMDELALAEPEKAPSTIAAAVEVLLESSGIDPDTISPNP